MKTKHIVQIAMIAAIYTSLSLLLAPISFGGFQIRFAESLNILVLIHPIYGVGVVLGCFLTNFIGVLQGSNTLGFIDVVVGPISTAIALYFCYRLRFRIIKKIPLMSLLSIIFCNGTLVGAELAFVFMKENLFIGFITFTSQVIIGETISMILGLLLYSKIKDNEVFKKD